MKTCGYEGCGRKHNAKGLCSAHYSQMARGEELRPYGYRPSITSRILGKAAADGECLIWQGHVMENGYGTVARYRARTHCKRGHPCRPCSRQKWHEWAARSDVDPTKPLAEGLNWHWPCVFAHALHLGLSDRIVAMVLETESEGERIRLAELAAKDVPS